MKPEMCWKQLQGQAGSALLHSPDQSVDLKAEYEEQNEQAERYEQKQGRPKNQGKTAPNSMICSQILYTKSQEDQWAIPEKSSLNFNCNSENQRNSSKNEFFPQKGKSAWISMHEWNWFKSLGRIVHHSSKHQLDQTSHTEKHKSRRGNWWTVTREKEKH